MHGWDICSKLEPEAHLAPESSSPLWRCLRARSDGADGLWCPGGNAPLQCGIALRSRDLSPSGETLSSKGIRPPWNQWQPHRPT